MNILELDSFNLADAVKFNDELNPRIWDGNKMRPEVREKLLAIAADFQESLGVDGLDVEDITVSGSNAGFTYTPHSDIDLHLVVRMPDECDEVYQELFNAKKYQYNDEHDIRIGGYDVELYVQPSDQPHVSAGVYSVAKDDWIHIPRKIPARVDDESVKNKYEDIQARIESALKSNDIDRMQKLWDKIKEMRKSGLAQNGELGPENLAFKMLRTQGDLGKLKDSIRRARDAELSLTERRKKKKKSRVKYGFGGYWYPGFAFGGSESGEASGGDGGGGESRVGEDVSNTPDGVSPSTKMFLSEKPVPNQTEIIFDFMKYAVHELGLHNVPTLKIKKDPQWSVIHKSFGRYRDDLGQIELAVGNRHIMDVLRTLAHELQHRKQDEREHMPPEAGATGSRFENEAHAVAGVLMRNYAELHPEYFEDVPVNESSGYIPTAKQKNDPRFKMALTVDVHPGQTGREANKMALKTDSQGKPGLLMKTANMIGESVPQPGPSSGAPKQFGPDAKIQTRQMTAKDIISSVPGVPYYNNVVDDWDAKDYSWGVTKKVIEYATYLKQHPETLSQLPPAIVLNGKFEDGAHRVSALWLLQQRMDPKNPLWKNAKLNVQFVQQGIKEGKSHGYNATPLSQVPGEQEDDLGNQEATGPEFPPQMPPGTTKIDVADLTDWYRLGQDISDMDDADPANYGKGPPQTVVVFPSDEAEQGYLKQFKRLGLKTHDIDPDVEGGEDVEGKHLEKALLKQLREYKEQDLFEIRMSTANLRQEAAKTGALAGMEFEMIVPDAKIEPPEPEYERDEDQDRRARSFNDIEEFFYDGDYNGRGDIRRLREALDEAYMEWKMDQVSDDWLNEGLDYMRDYIENNDLFDREEALDTARDEIIDANPDLPTDSEEFQQLVNARINELQEEFVQNEFDAQGNLYNDAFTEFTNEKNDDYDEADFLRDMYPYMSDIENQFDISWPYYYDINADSEGETNVDEIADDFSDAIGMPVNASNSYHGARREAGHYVVEPDGSLEGNDANDAGLEFVSPPMPIDQMLNDLDAVKKWAGRRGCYTNSSTGLHINISVPGYSLDKLDYVKLALLMGDEYVLEEFGRMTNTYTKAATEKIRTALRKNPDLAPALMDKMRGHMEDLATKAIHSGVTDKYTSINTKTGYIEFRSPGGDWLDANFDKIENTLLRFTVAMDAALNPEKYRKEYLKKLYKLLESTQSKEDADVLQLFANYSSGELDKAALIRQVREKQLARNLAKGKVPAGQKYWWSVGRPGYFASVEVVAQSKEEAIEKGKKEYPDWANARDMTAKPLRPYQEPEKKPEQKGNWGIWITSANHFARAPGQTDDSVLRRFPGRDSALQWIEQTRRERPDLRTDIEVREIEPATTQPQQGSGAYTFRVFTTDNNQTVGTFQASGIQGSTNANIAFRNYLTSIGRDSAAGFNYEEIGRERSTAPAASQDNWSQDFERRMQQPEPQPLGAGRELVGWKIVDPQGRTIHEFSGIGNAQSDANAFAVNWLRRNPQHMQAGVEVVPNWREA